MRKMCLVCNVEFDGRRTQRYCSRSCAARGAKAFDIASQGAQGGRAGRGRVQTPEHVEKRVEAMRVTLASQVRSCAECGESYTPRTNAQRYCSGRCAESVRRRRSYLSHRTGAERRRMRARLTPEEYEALLHDQGGACAICKTTPEYRLCVDHNHQTERVRGLLCHRCNTALGLLSDDPSLLEAAIRYLKEM